MILLLTAFLIAQNPPQPRAAPVIEHWIYCTTLDEGGGVSFSPPTAISKVTVQGAALEHAKGRLRARASRDSLEPGTCFAFPSRSQAEIDRELTIKATRGRGISVSDRGWRPNGQTPK